MKAIICHSCGCVVKPDEWATETICIDCR